MLHNSEMYQLDYSDNDPVQGNDKPFQGSHLGRLLILNLFVPEFATAIPPKAQLLDMLLFPVGLSRHDNLAIGFFDAESQLLKYRIVV